MTSVGLSLFNYQDDARSNKHKIYFEPRNIVMKQIYEKYIQYMKNTYMFGKEGR